MSTNHDIKTFKTIAVSCLVFCLATPLIYILIIFIDSGLMNYDICFTSDCVNSLLKPFDKLPAMVDMLTKVLTAIITVMGVYYALLNYLSTSSTSRTNVYLLHLNTFRDYITTEQAKESRIDKKSIDILKWYNQAFPLASTGNFEIGKLYKENIKAMLKTILESNKKFEGDILTPHSYKIHQTEIITELKKIGFSIQRLPKNDFFEVENSIIELINKVNQELCREPRNLPNLPFTKFK